MRQVEITKGASAVKEKSRHLALGQSKKVREVRREGGKTMERQ